jgi:UDP-N-acetylmuramoyl-L-alanyl-D-glutamate--2,6-diaminopimelate ligase
VRLSALAAEVSHRRTGAPGDPEIATITHDSRRSGPGTLFAAFPGTREDGRRFLPDAVRRGASAALGLAPAPRALPVPYLEVENPRRSAGLFAATLTGHPAERLLMVGVTGTSGKTTTTLLLDRILAARHEKRGFFGTLVYRGAGGDAAAIPASRTTPEATELQPMLAALVADGGTAASLECSSHALALERLAGCSFDVAVFLNLSRDHLDFHRNMDDYFEAKARLFGMLKKDGKAVINVGDPWGKKLAALLPQPCQLSFFLEGNEEKSGPASAPAQGRVVPSAAVTGTPALSPAGTQLHVVSSFFQAEFSFFSPLLGRPNAENLLAAAAAGLALGYSGTQIARALASVDTIPGRLERIPNTRGLTVLVDYAHKPGALEGVLGTARSLVAPTGGRVVLVFGCGGDRDKGKRPQMGRIAAALADEIVVTSDNSRSENPWAILEDIRAGIVPTGKDAAYIVDRREAISEALKRARAGDVLLIAGKGHEAYQVIGNREEPFDDREVARQLLGTVESGRRA